MPQAFRNIFAQFRPKKPRDECQKRIVPEPDNGRSQESRAARPRALTPPLALDTDTGINQITIHQSASHLLSKFPLEIRIQIYSMAMGGNLIHILRLLNWKRWLGRKLAHVRCLSSKESEYHSIWHDCWGNRCSSRKRWDWHYMDAKKPNSSDDAGLALLLSCRQV